MALKHVVCNSKGELTAATVQLQKHRQFAGAHLWPCEGFSVVHKAELATQTGCMVVFAVVYHGIIISGKNSPVVLLQPKVQAVTS